MSEYIADIESGGLSVTGTVREDNQDSIHLPPSEHPPGFGLLYGLADGMGGYAHGGVASLLALQAFANALAAHNGTAPHKALQRAVETANLQVFQRAQRLGAARMGTTLTAAYLIGGWLHLAHVGDSRAYLIRDGRAVCLTADHTTVGDMVRSKLLSPEKIRTHAQRSVLTRAIGLTLFVQPDISQHRLREGDRLILCSDGVWSVIEDGEFARIAGASAPDGFSRELINLALSRETDDNASVVAFHLKKLSPLPDAGGSPANRSWLQSLRKKVS